MGTRILKKSSPILLAKQKNPRKIIYGNSAQQGKLTSHNDLSIKATLMFEPDVHVNTYFSVL